MSKFVCPGNTFHITSIKTTSVIMGVMWRGSIVQITVTLMLRSTERLYSPNTVDIQRASNPHMRHKLPLSPFYLPLRELQFRQFK